jgi:uncharacterized HhH-GPD family protein
MTETPAIPVTGEDEADRLLEQSPLALLVGMLLDQQVPMEWAFLSPYRLKERLGGTLDAAAIAEADPDELEAVFRDKPALHRFPAAMARRTQELCRQIVERYGGDAGAVWRDVDDGEVLLSRLEELPGYGEQKAKILLALLAKRLGVAPPGWEKAAGLYADDRPRSVADIDTPGAVQAVREWKRAEKAKG